LDDSGFATIDQQKELAILCINGIGRLDGSCLEVISKCSSLRRLSIGPFCRNFETKNLLSLDKLQGLESFSFAMPSSETRPSGYKLFVQSIRWRFPSMSISEQRKTFSAAWWKLADWKRDVWTKRAEGSPQTMDHVLALSETLSALKVLDLAFEDWAFPTTRILVQGVEVNLTFRGTEKCNLSNIGSVPGLKTVTFDNFNVTLEIITLFCRCNPSLREVSVSVSAKANNLVYPRQFLQQFKNVLFSFH